jgi:hypothetical protein
MEKKLLKGNTSYDKVFINEDLTTLRFKLFHYIKSMDLVKSVTTRDGKMHCQMKNSRKEVVENPDDLFKLGVNNITYVLTLAYSIWSRGDREGNLYSSELRVFLLALV